MTGARGFGQINSHAWIRSDTCATMCGSYAIFIFTDSFRRYWKKQPRPITIFFTRQICKTGGYRRPVSALPGETLSLWRVLPESLLLSCSSSNVFFAAQVAQFSWSKNILEPIHWRARDGFVGRLKGSLIDCSLGPGCRRRS